MYLSGIIVSLCFFLFMYSRFQDKICENQQDRKIFAFAYPVVAMLCSALSWVGIIIAIVKLIISRSK